MLELRDVETFYGSIKALKGISLEVPGGSIVSIIGANGAGKTTTLRTISGLTPPASGSVTFLGERIEKLTPEEIVERGISHVPENRQVFPDLNVLENLMMGAYTRKDRQGIQRDLEEVYQLFPVLGERRRQRGATLSGGEQQMLAIGRALMSQPKLLLLDEASLGLAPLVVSHIFQVVRALNKERGMTLLVVEQNVRLALAISQFSYVMVTGQVFMADTSERLRTNEQVVRSYLGRT